MSESERMLEMYVRRLNDSRREIARLRGQDAEITRLNLRIERLRAALLSLFEKYDPYAMPGADENERVYRQAEKALRGGSGEE